MTYLLTWSCPLSYIHISLCYPLFCLVHQSDWCPFHIQPSNLLLTICVNLNLEFSPSVPYFQSPNTQTTYFFFYLPYCTYIYIYFSDLLAVYQHNILLLRNVDKITPSAPLSWESLVHPLPKQLSYPVGLAADPDTNRIFVSESIPDEEEKIFSVSMDSNYTVDSMVTAVKSKLIFFWIRPVRLFLCMLPTDAAQQHAALLMLYHTD